MLAAISTHGGSYKSQLFRKASWPTCLLKGVGQAMAAWAACPPMQHWMGWQPRKPNACKQCNWEAVPHAGSCQMNGPTHTQRGHPLSESALGECRIQNPGSRAKLDSKYVSQMTSTHLLAQLGRGRGWKAMPGRSHHLVVMCLLGGRGQLHSIRVT